MPCLDKKAIISLSPKEVWKHFYDISQIPRESGDEKRIREHIKQFAHKQDLTYRIDSTGNIIVKRPPAKGKEQSPGIVLQGHLDMVCVKEPGYEHNFSTDPIVLIQEGDWITADRTTLGADNGIAVAVMLAILEDKQAAYGPIEALFTVSEETGLNGAFDLDISLIEGTYLINLDSEEEGVFYIGSAGGSEVAASLQQKRESVDGHCLDWIPKMIRISGLSGGHSGGDIHLGRANAVKECARYLKYLTNKTDVRIAAFNGGTKRNVIPSDCTAVFLVPPEGKTGVTEVFERYKQSFFDIYADTDSEALIELEDVHMPDFVFPIETSKALINAVFITPHGIDRMSSAVPGMVETSNNLASITTTENEIRIDTSQRSAVESARNDLSLRVAACLESSGAQTKISNSYPAWTPNPKAVLPGIASRVYQSAAEQPPRITAIHAGLECGIITGKAPQMESISMGPTLQNVHSTNERVSISSVERFYAFLKKLLEAV